MQDHIEKKRVPLERVLQNSGHETLVDLMAEAIDDGICHTRCVHGCTVEPDGICEHGVPSILREEGLI